MLCLFSCCDISVNDLKFRKICGLFLSNRRPVDTSMQIGTFGLLRQSVVYVQHPDHRGECRHTNFKTDNRLASFFGLYRIA